MAPYGTVWRKVVKVVKVVTLNDDSRRVKDQKEMSRIGKPGLRPKHYCIGEGTCGNDLGHREVGCRYRRTEGLMQVYERDNKYHS
jgi:hypothetical protein